MGLLRTGIAVDGSRFSLILANAAAAATHRRSDVGMPEAVPNGVWTRQTWVAERGGAKTGEKVPKGAAKVSMGDALDKFHKRSAKGAKEGKAAAAELTSTIEDYRKAIQAKYPKLAQRLHDRLVGYELKNYLAEVDNVTKALQLYPQRHATVIAEMQKVGAEFLQWEKQGAHGSFKPSNAKEAGKALEQFQGPLAYVPYSSDKIKRADVKSFDGAVMTAAGGTWNKPTVEGLLRLLPKFPATV